jgi:hypothetical protein
MAPPPTQVSVTAPIRPAIERARHLLFRPFDLAKWFTLGFCAWLAHLGEGGFSGGYSPRFSSSRGFSPVPSLPDLHGAGERWEQIRDEVTRNLYWIVPLAVALAAFILVLSVLMMWLSSRGEFMFLHCVALNRAEVAVPWRQHAGKARSLFFFRLAIGLIAVVTGLLLLATIGVLLWRIFRQGGSDPGVWLPLIGAVLALCGVGLVLVIVAMLTRDFVVPIMYLRGGTCREAWSELLGLFAGRLHLPIVYLLFQIVLGLAIGIAILVIVIATCCLAGCLLLLPYLGTVALLPVLVFHRSYSVYYLGQFGAQYDLFQAAAAPPVSPA